MVTRRAVVGGLALGGAAVLASAGWMATRGGGVEEMGSLLHDPDQPILGNPEGDVTLVEFFDYQCPFCRQSHPDLMRMVEEDSNLRLVMKDWPIFGTVSLHAVRVGLGAATLGRYAEMNAALMALSGRRLSPEEIDAAAANAGVDAAAALAAFDSEADRWNGLVARNMAQARALGLQGTPSYLVGERLFVGMTGAEQLAQAVASLRGG